MRKGKLYLILMPMLNSNAEAPRRKGYFTTKILRHKVLKAGWGEVKYWIISLLFIIAASPIFAQKTIKLKHADNSIGRTVRGERQDWLVGNVVFVQNQTTIYCDSAKRNKKENSLEAFGNIKITDGDSVTVTSLSLTYDGNKRIAKLRKNVIFNKLNTATLYTDFLDFDRARNLAKYFNGGKLVDSTNTLTSRKGYYDTRTNMASFKTDVVGVSKDATINSDTLQYHTKTKVVYFRDKTVVKDAEGKLATYTSGYYDTQSQFSTIALGTIETQSYIIRGDDYQLDDKKQFYRATHNVVMTSKEENLIIYSDRSDYNKAKGFTKIFGHCYLAKIDAPGDTLFLSADTLISIESKYPKKKRLLAYHNVKIFKSDMQGLADSLVYVSIDSMLYFYRNPALWNGENQMTADSIRILLRNKNIDKIYMVGNSFVASQDSLDNFNQMKGRLMTTHFQNKKIHHVDVQGNGQSLYYATEQKEIKDSTVTVRITFLTGMNKIECSNMKINFADGQVNNITFIKKPDAAFIPPHEIKPEDRVLNGFSWRGKERPRREDVVKVKPSNQDAKTSQPKSPQ
jgi:lipopolysaccharide export system protein LptA